ncbi:MAG: response regulator [Pedobacter sp.]|nr:MAG: response regulator [Pedobacter sp.]
MALRSKSVKSILVIEDNHAILDVITLILQSEAYKVTGLGKSADIMRQIELLSPDLLILDIMLPDGDGRELLTQLRKDPTTEKIPVLMISAKYTEKNVEHGEFKPNAFMAKPFDIDNLLDKIEGIMAGKTYI